MTPTKYQQAVYAFVRGESGYSHEAAPAEVAWDQPLPDDDGPSCASWSIDFLGKRNAVVEAVAGRVDTVVGLDVKLALQLLTEVGFPDPLPRPSDVSVAPPRVRRPLSPMRACAMRTPTSRISIRRRSSVRSRRRCARPPRCS